MAALAVAEGAAPQQAIGIRRHGPMIHIIGMAVTAAPQSLVDFGDGIPCQLWPVLARAAPGMAGELLPPNCIAPNREDSGRRFLRQKFQRAPGCPLYATAAKPCFSTSDSSLSDVPEGFFSPRSHLLTKLLVTFR